MRHGAQGQYQAVPNAAGPRRRSPSWPRVCGAVFVEPFLPLYTPYPFHGIGPRDAVAITFPKRFILAAEQNFRPVAKAPLAVRQQRVNHEFRSRGDTSSPSGCSVNGGHARPPAGCETTIGLSSGQSFRFSAFASSPLRSAAHLEQKTKPTAAVGRAIAGKTSPKIVSGETFRIGRGHPQHNPGLSRGASLTRRLDSSNAPSNPAASSSPIAAAASNSALSSG
jgi:hypothetical protein